MSTMALTKGSSAESSNWTASSSASQADTYGELSLSLASSSSQGKWLQSSTSLKVPAAVDTEDPSPTVSGFEDRTDG